MKARVNYKIYDVKNWKTNNYNTDSNFKIYYLKKYKKPDNEV